VNLINEFSLLPAEQPQPELPLEEPNPDEVIATTEVIDAKDF
jgi:hypothetical protein